MQVIALNAFSLHKKILLMLCSLSYLWDTYTSFSSAFQAISLRHLYFFFCVPSYISEALILLLLCSLLYLWDTYTSSTAFPAISLRHWYFFCIPTTSLRHLYFFCIPTISLRHLYFCVSCYISETLILLLFLRSQLYLGDTYTSSVFPAISRRHLYFFICVPSYFSETLTLLLLCSLQYLWDIYTYSVFPSPATSLRHLYFSAFPVISLRHLYFSAFPAISLRHLYFFFCIPSYISETLTVLRSPLYLWDTYTSSTFPAISLRHLYFFFCVPSYISETLKLLLLLHSQLYRWGSPSLVRFLGMWLFYSNHTGSHIPSSWTDTSTTWTMYIKECL